MIKTKETKNIELRNSKGITLVSLIITIVLMVIISSSAVYVSYERFEINKLNKMYNDIELLSDKVSNYYLKYNGLPVIRDDANNSIEYTYTTLDFEKNTTDNEVYYILDLEAMEGLSLNYGKEGFNNPNTSDDVYIINEKSHKIYYVKGIELEGIIYHTITDDTDTVSDNIPPSKPEIKIISGTADDNGTYITGVEIEIIPGNDNWSGIDKTTYVINNGTEIDITTLTNSIYTITEDGTYEIKARSYDKNGNISEYTTQTIVIAKPTISLDKTEISLEIEAGGTATQTLTATVTNVTGDLTWKVTEDSGITISGEGNTKTITVSKAVENATITVSYGAVSATCSVNVKETEFVTVTLDITSYGGTFYRFYIEDNMVYYEEVGKILGIKVKKGETVTPPDTAWTLGLALEWPIAVENYEELMNSYNEGTGRYEAPYIEEMPAYRRYTDGMLIGWSTESPTSAEMSYKIDLSDFIANEDITLYGWYD